MPYDLIYWQVAGRPRPTVEQVEAVLRKSPACARWMSVSGDTVAFADMDTGARFQVLVGRAGPPRAPQPGFEEAYLVFRIDLNVPVYFGLEAFPHAVRLQDELDLFVENPRIEPGSPALLRTRSEALQQLWKRENSSAVRAGDRKRPTLPTAKVTAAWRHNLELALWPDRHDGLEIPQTFVVFETAKNRSFVCCRWSWGEGLTLPRVCDMVLAEKPTGVEGEPPAEILVSVDELVLRIGRFNRPCPVPACDAYGPCDERALARLAKMPAHDRTAFEALPLTEVIDRELIDDSDDEKAPSTELRKNRRALVKKEEPPRLYRAGQPLGREGLFELICDEVFRDGVVEAWENRLLQAVMHFLQLEPATALAIAGHARQRFDMGLLGGPGPLEPMRLYERLLTFVLSDSRIDATEAAMLEGMRQVLKIPEATHKVLQEKVRAAGTDPLDGKGQKRVVVPADLHVLGAFRPAEGRPFAIEVDATGRIAAFGPHTNPMWGRTSAISTTPLKRLQLVDILTTIQSSGLLERPVASGPTPAGGARELDLRIDGRSVHYKLPMTGEVDPADRAAFLAVWKVLALFFRLSIRETTAELLDSGAWEVESQLLWSDPAQRDADVAAAVLRHGLATAGGSAALYTRTDDPEHGRWLAEVYTGLKLHGNGEVFDARAAFQRALKCAENLGAADYHAAYALDALAAMNCHLGRIADAAPLLKKAVASCEAAFGKDHFTLQPLLEHLAWVYRKINQPADANPCEDRAADIGRKWAAAKA